MYMNCAQGTSGSLLQNRQSQGQVVPLGDSSLPPMALSPVLKDSVPECSFLPATLSLPALRVKSPYLPKRTVYKKQNAGYPARKRDK